MLEKSSFHQSPEQQDVLIMPFDEPISKPKIEKKFKPEEKNNMTKNVAMEMVDTYFESWLGMGEEFKEDWFNQHPVAKDELIEQAAKEMSNNYKLMTAGMRTREQINKYMCEDYLKRKTDQILIKYGVFKKRKKTTKL